MQKQETPTARILEIAKRFDLCNISSVVLENPKFSIWSGSSKPHQHHYGKGGLAQHTLEVIELALMNNEYYRNIVHPKQLFLAALFHDAGKMWDYRPIYQDVEGLQVTDYKDWESCEHKRHVHHITRSALVWHDAVKEFGPFGWDEDNVLHAILAHHQLREWGSPVSPNTRLAWLVHLADGISARIDDGDRWDRTKGESCMKKF